jgi:hypothetical protein
MKSSAIIPTHNDEEATALTDLLAPTGFVLLATLLRLPGLGAQSIAFKDNWRDAVAYVKQHQRPGDVVLLYTTHSDFLLSTTTGEKRQSNP